VLRYETDAGERAEPEGWGECTALPEPSYSSEYTAGAVEVSEAYLLPALLSARVATAGDVAPALAAVKGHKMAKAAFEAALLDAELRAAGLRMADFLASLSRSGQPPKAAVVAGVAVGLQSSLGELLDEVERYVAEGYLRVKLKIAPGWDDKPLGEVRRRWPELVLFADANGAYADMGPVEAAARLARVDGYGLACIEQPLGDDDLAGHRELARQLRTPLCLDEALTSVASVSAALDMGACSVVNVKAGRFGGYLEAVRVHDLCADRGVPVWCGGMVETGIGRAANVALASLPNFALPGDLSASGRFFEQDLAGPLELGPAGTISVPGGPGTGVTVSPGALRAFATWRRWYPAS
jgi:O-succinylbenzoate synthase